MDEKSRLGKTRFSIVTRFLRSSLSFIKSAGASTLQERKKSSTLDNFLHILWARLIGSAKNKLASLKDAQVRNNLITSDWRGKILETLSICQRVLYIPSANFEGFQNCNNNMGVADLIYLSMPLIKSHNVGKCSILSWVLGKPQKHCHITLHNESSHMWLCSFI